MNQENNIDKEQYIIAQQGTRVIRILRENIMYLLNAKRGSSIVVSTDEYCVNSDEPLLIKMKLNDFYEKMEQYGFEFASERCLVNLNYVKMYGKNELTLLNGQKLSVSRKCNKVVKERVKTFGIM